MMTKDQLLSAVAERSGASKAEVGRVLAALEETVHAEVAAGNDVRVPGIATVKVVDRAARTANNPRTGEKISIPARKAVALRAVKGLKDAV